MIRDVGFLCWKQKTAWMESMSGTRWNSMVKKENKHFLNAVKKVANEEQLFSKSHEFMEANGSMFFSHKNIILKVLGDQYEWFYVNSKKTYIVSDIAFGEYIYHTRDIGNGAQKYRVECIKDGKVLWYKDNVGSQVCVCDDICFILGANALWYNCVIALDCKTGKVLDTIYEESDRKYNLSFVKGEGALFLLRDNSGKEELFIIDNLLRVLQIQSEASSFFPIGYYKNKLCYLENIDNIWIAKGFSMKSFTNEIEYFSLERGVFILREDGLKTIYTLRFKKVYSFYGNIYFHPLRGSKFFIDFTDSGIQDFSFEKDISVCTVPYCEVKRKFAISEDNTEVPYILAIPPCEIKGLLVAAYGAYGIPSNLSTRRWKPYLEDGGV